MTPEPLLSPEDIAGLTGMSYHGVLRDIRSGKLKATRKGKGYHVKPAWYDDWLEADIVTPTEPAQFAAPRPHGPRPGRVSPGSVADLDAIEREAAA